MENSTNATILKSTFQSPTTSVSATNETKEILTAIACLTFFPSIYFIGKIIMGTASQNTEFLQSFFWL